MITQRAKNPMTLKEFIMMPDNEVFASGTILNHPEGLYMTSSDIGKRLKWLAKKGSVNDFAVYCYWDGEMSDEDILSYGQKVPGSCVVVLKRLLNLEDAVWERYRR